MAGPFYCDPAAGGANDGSDWTNAWETFQDAIDGTNDAPPAAGEICYCRGTDTLVADIDLDMASGTIAGGYIKFIGCNAGGSVDGTRFDLDGNAAVADIFQTTSAQYIWFENFEFHNSTADLFGNTTTKYVFINCIFHDCGDDAISSGSSSIFLRCAFYNITDDAMGGFAAACALRCVFYSVTGKAINFSGADGARVSKCVFHDNADGEACISDADNTNLICDNVIDGTGTNNGIGILLETSGEQTVVDGNRITNFSAGAGVGMNADSSIGVYGFNLFDNNATDVSNAGAYEVLPMDADTDTNEYDPDVDDGYNNVGNDDFNLKASRTYNGDGNDVVGLNIGS